MSAAWVRPAAVFFDMDGLLVDTEVLWSAVMGEAVGSVGQDWTESDQHATLGAPLEVSARYILARRGVAADGADRLWPGLAAWLVEAMVARVRGGVAVQPGALELLDELTAAGVPLALVSNSQRLLVDAVLATVGAGRFDATVSASEVGRPKPHPEPYVTAAERLAVDPAGCVVLEDSVTGATAGLAAGCAVVAVPTLPGLVFDARVRRVGSLRDVDLALLARAVGRARWS